MKIKKGLSRFDKGAALILVTGNLYGRMIYAHEGELEEVSDFNEPKPVYSDREGYFLKSGRGIRYGSGSVYENKKKESVKRFFKKMAGELKEFLKDHNEVGKLYLFNPRATLDEAKRALPASARRLLVCSFGMNFTKKHPFEIVAKITAGKDRIEPDAKIRKIMRSSKKNKRRRK